MQAPDTNIIYVYIFILLILENSYHRYFIVYIKSTPELEIDNTLNHIQLHEKLFVSASHIFYFQILLWKFPVLIRI